ncbi:MAG TPA: hypothetical protein VKU77_31695 [Streptosporangiaceae bacterium]|nr:hypothetical protein [Streptosporangiaceae bacterium]
MSNTVRRTVKCHRCGHALRAEASIRAGYSRRCLRLARAGAIETALAGYSAAQQGKALRLLAAGGLRPSSRPSVWLADSSDGKTVYVVRPDGCDCPGGTHGLACYHQAARRAALAALAIAA